MDSMNPNAESATTTLPSDTETKMSEQEQRERQRKEERRKEHIAMLESALKSVRPYNTLGTDMTDDAVYNLHARLIAQCASHLLSRHGKRLILDEYNKDVFKFLMLYFNGSPLALDVFPDANYSLDKNIMLVGEAGVGKTLIMDAMAMYLEKTHNPRAYKTVSHTQMLNYFKLHNNIDLFTFNTSDNDTYEGKPFSLCLNDMGLRTQKFYGNDTEAIIEEFLYARYEIWEQAGMATHITTNLDKNDIERLFNDEHGRLADRFKMFNVIHVGGSSRR